MSGRTSPASCYLLEATDPVTGRTHSLTLDFGPGAMGKLLNHMDPAELDAMAFSHMHADHCADIVGMQVYRRWNPDGKLPQIPVYCPGDGVMRTRGIAADPEDEDYADVYDFRQVKPGMTAEVGPMHLEFFEAWHTIEATAIRISGPSEEDPSKTVTMTFSGDTDWCETLVESARDVDVFLCESAFEEKRDLARGIHLTGKRAGQVAAAAGAKSLYLTHLQPWTSRETARAEAESVYDGPVECVMADQVIAF